mmetsp:Transcript_14632/g.55311  ORF Transcript_14632/g.55311 Transcript_14632/m.55311 type:complete len:241 (-) Transcript_14632:231-953(-)
MLSIFSRNEMRLLKYTSGLRSGLDPAVLGPADPADPAVSAAVACILLGVSTPFPESPPVSAGVELDASTPFDPASALRASPAASEAVWASGAPLGPRPSTDASPSSGLESAAAVSRICLASSSTDSGSCGASTGAVSGSGGGSTCVLSGSSAAVAGAVSGSARRSACPAAGCEVGSSATGSISGSGFTCATSGSGTACATAVSGSAACCCSSSTASASSSSGIGAGMLPFSDACNAGLST